MRQRSNVPLFALRFVERNLLPLIVSQLHVCDVTFDPQKISPALSKLLEHELSQLPIWSSGPHSRNRGPRCCACHAFGEKKLREGIPGFFGEMGGGFSNNFDPPDNQHLISACRCRIRFPWCLGHRK
jgi:hypothetical protein